MREPEFPALRLRRLRRTPELRALARETRLAPAALVCPLFVRSGEGIREPIGSMPGQFRLSVDQLVAECADLATRGVGGVLLFGLPESKDAAGSGAWAPDGIVQRAIRALRDDGSPLVVAADVCLCEYTDHGHCGVLEDGRVANDPTLELLARSAVSLAEAGADVVAPSAMMDGQVAAIRRALDGEGRSETPIVAYAAKYASSFFGPFREAADSAPRSGDRRGYQMDPPNGREALREMAADLAEGADVLMVKPALPYLDVLRRARQRFDAPLAAYQVSGEYAMIAAAGERGWIDREAAALESLTAIARAGADIVITYFAKEAADWLS
ncbi:MAG TPA: porphobilinogen synthase [Gemmatimonadota bacterium]|nr:porphobilinogen synthase [Gemmatimonadota bacterium]